MTSITIRSEGDRYRLTAEGHATGSEAVCAAVSGLIYALGGYLKHLEQSGEVAVGALHLEPGRAEITATGAPAGPPFAMAAVGLMQIQDGYPRQLRVRAERKSST